MSWRGLPGEALTFACAGAGVRGAVGRYSHFSDNHCGHLFLDEQTASSTLEGGGIERSIAVRSIGNAHLIGGRVCLRRAVFVQTGPPQTRGARSVCSPDPGRQTGRRATRLWTPFDAIPVDLRIGQRHIRNQMVHGHRPDDVHVREVKLLEQLEQLFFQQWHRRVSAGALKWESPCGVPE